MCQDWMLIDLKTLESFSPFKRVVQVPAGCLVIWDSRTFHQNQYGTLPELRMVVYVSYLPKSHRSPAEKVKRLKYLLKGRTTSHWAYPVKVNGEQPQTYGDPRKVIKKELLTPLMFEKDEEGKIIIPGNILDLI